MEPTFKIRLVPYWSFTLEKHTCLKGFKVVFADCDESIPPTFPDIIICLGSLCGKDMLHHKHFASSTVSTSDAT